MCVYYDRTVAHQYSTLKNEKLHTISYTVQTISAQSYTQSNIAVQFTICEHMRRQVPIRWLCDIQLMGVLDRLEK